ncbi:MAG: hypothetical protein L3J46_10185 [Kangiellaceae bacterium]|nr:hypothetical protein [Kangiellaceae bacterium]
MATIQHRGPYQWRVQVRRKGYPIQRKTFETKAEANAWARQIESEMDRGVFRSIAEAERTTLEELLDRYRKEITPLKKGSKQEFSKLNVIKKFEIAKFAVAKVGGKELAEFRDARLEKVSPKTVRDDLVLLGHVFN